VPETPHISAYLHIFTLDVRSSINHKIPANSLIDGHSSLVTSLIAMQKVVGSNPISRFL
jgi:hypothetical protein